MIVFLDTNIAIDALQNRHPFANSAKMMLALSYMKEFSIQISASQFTDAFYLLSGGGKKSLAPGAKAALKTLRKAVTVASFHDEEIDRALNSPWDDFEDACVYQCAVSAKADVIVTRNQKDFEKSAIPVMDCDEFFAYLEQEKGLVYDFIQL